MLDRLLDQLLREDFEHVLRSSPRACIAVFVIGAFLSYLVVTFIQENRINSLQERIDDLQERLDLKSPTDTSFSHVTNKELQQQIANVTLAMQQLSTQRKIQESSLWAAERRDMGALPEGDSEGRSKVWLEYRPKYEQADHDMMARYGQCCLVTALNLAEESLRRSSPNILSHLNLNPQRELDSLAHPMDSDDLAKKAMVLQLLGSKLPFRVQDYWTDKVRLTVIGVLCFVLGFLVACSRLRSSRSYRNHSSIIIAKE
jgi:hypothetical protein